MARNTNPFRGETFYNPNAKYGMGTLGMMGLKTLFSPTEDKTDGVNPLIIDEQTKWLENNPDPRIIQDDQSQPILDGQEVIDLNIPPPIQQLDNAGIPTTWAIDGNYVSKEEFEAYQNKNRSKNNMYR